VEYKYIFLTLLTLVSKSLCNMFIVMLQLHNLLVSKWRQWRRNPSVFCGITKQNRRISPSLTSLYGGMLRTECFRHQFQILQIWRQE